MRVLSSKVVRNIVNVDDKRDELLTEFGKRTMRDRYMQEGESYQDVFARAAVAFSGGDRELAQRLYDYSSRLWFMFATPLISNGGTERGLPISCFLNYVGDSVEGLTSNFTENAFLATNGGGIGSFWGDVRSVGERTSRGVETPGAIPFIHCIDSQMLAYHQGSTRRGAAAVYMDISHPEIYEFINMRSSTGGDVHRKNENLHHGVGLTDSFMLSVQSDDDWDLVDPNSGALHKRVRARELWIKLLQQRVKLGEPYLFFKDTANKALPDEMKEAGLTIHHANLCTEIVLPTAVDRTAVCCLSSINLAKFEEWEGYTEQFISDLVTMLDNTLDVFIQEAPSQLWRAVYSASQERSLGLGALGFHTLLQQRGIPIEHEDAWDLNNALFQLISHVAYKRSMELGSERGPAPAVAFSGLRNSHLMAVAPNSTTSIICGGVSPSIEPMAANVFAHKTLSGTHEVRNPALVEVLKKHDMNTDEVWASIAVNRGSVQHLDFLTDWERAVFKTAIEIDQMVLIRLAAQRQKFICQSQSLNLFVPADVEARQLHNLHMSAWRSGLKALYYLRSESIKSAEIVSSNVDEIERPTNCDDEVCTACEG